jgi:hypothetical protein
MQFLFLKQSHSGSDAKLCAFFALYHFKNGGITREQYVAAASQAYIDIGMDKDDAKEMALDGNDPETLVKFGLKAGNKGAVDSFEVLIVCDTTRGHFFAIRKQGDKWYSYDSWKYDEATLIGDNDAAKAVCGAFQVYYS